MKPELSLVNFLPSHCIINIPADVQISKSYKEIYEIFLSKPMQSEV